MDVVDTTTLGPNMGFLWPEVFEKGRNLPSKFDCVIDVCCCVYVIYDVW